MRHSGERAGHAAPKESEPRRLGKSELLAKFLEPLVDGESVYKKQIRPFGRILCNCRSVALFWFVYDRHLSLFYVFSLVISIFYYYVLLFHVMTFFDMLYWYHSEL